jgi:hypothetical protein
VWVYSDCGGFCQAIVDTTKAKWGRGPDVNHIGLIEIVKGKIYVYEALPGVGTTRTAYIDLIRRLESQPSKKKMDERVIFGSIRKPYRKIFKRIVRDARRQLGLPYNDLFQFESNLGPYCSQWFQDLSAKNNNGVPLWTWQKMLFVGKYWEQYFKVRGATPPNGQLGVSPLGMYNEGKGKIFD